MIREWIDKLKSYRILFLVSPITGAFIIYPLIFDLPEELMSLTSREEYVEHIIFFIYRYLYFCLLTWLLLKYNVHHLKKPFFPERLSVMALITVAAYGVYALIAGLSATISDAGSGLLIFQFVVNFLICIFIAGLIAMYSKQREHILEIEHLKTDNLKSRFDALSGQINPHFFFNSLNGLSSLVRSNKKQQTLEYINKLSEVFRYILQSDKRSLVELNDELGFLASFGYLQELRYGEHLRIIVNVPEDKKTKQLPVLSLLPLIGNIVKHNVIDSENKMVVVVSVNENDELLISNPVRRKLEEDGPHGLGLTNLADRFALMLNKKIRIEPDEDGYFNVYLPLT